MRLRATCLLAVIAGWNEGFLFRISRGFFLVYSVSQQDPKLSFHDILNGLGVSVRPVCLFGRVYQEEAIFAQTKRFRVVPSKLRGAMFTQMLRPIAE